MFKKKELLVRHKDKETYYSLSTRYIDLGDLKFEVKPHYIQFEYKQKRGWFNHIIGIFEWTPVIDTKTIEDLR